MWHPLQKSLSNKLAVAFALASFATAAVVGTLTYMFAREALVEEAILKMQSIAQAQENHLITVINMRWWQLDQVASKNALRTLLATTRGDIEQLNDELKATCDLGRFGELN